MARSKKVWNVIYIDRRYIDPGNLEKYQGLYDIKISIPTILVLKRVTKGKNDYQEVPYLFNLGFLRVPKNKRYDIDYLCKLRREIPFIMGYLRDTMLGESGNNYAMVSAQEINRIIEDANSKSIYDNVEEVLKIGDVVELTGYPWAGLTAEVISINKEKEKAKVRVKEKTFDITVEIPLYNICYTQYTEELDGTSIREDYIEDINPGRVNKIYATVSLDIEDNEY